MGKTVRRNLAIAATVIAVLGTAFYYLRGNGRYDRCDLSLPDGGQIRLLRYPTQPQNALTLFERIFDEQYLILGIKSQSGERYCYVLDASDYHGLPIPLALSLHGNRVQIRNGLMGRGYYDLGNLDGRYDGRRMTPMQVPKELQKPLFED